MRNVYTLVLAFLTLPLYYSCSKDFLKPYDDRIIGTWKITDIDRFGIGSSKSLSFFEGDLITFSDNGELIATSTGNTYRGSWDIRKEYTDDKTMRSLHITAVDFNNQNVRSEFFNDMAFTNTNRFKAFIHSGARTYVFHFLRQ